ncbi:unnamed protein product, partial [Symbiodinium sp. KB8]
PVDFSSLGCAFEILFAASMPLSAMARVACATLLAVCCAVRQEEHQSGSGGAAATEPNPVLVPKLTLKEHAGEFDADDDARLSSAIPKCWAKVNPPATGGYGPKLVDCILGKYRYTQEFGHVSGEFRMVISSGSIKGHALESRGWAVYNYQGHDILFWDDSA